MYTPVIDVKNHTVLPTQWCVLTNEPKTLTVHNTWSEYPIVDTHVVYYKKWVCNG